MATTPAAAWDHAEIAAAAGADLFLVQSQVSSARHISTSGRVLSLSDLTGALHLPVLVGNTVSLGAAVLFFRQGGRPLLGRASGHLWFIAAGISNALSLQFLNNALAVGDVVAVVPVVSATPVFTLLLGVVFFGRERITWRTLATIALIVPGVILVALHTAR